MAVKNHKKANLRLQGFRDRNGDTLSRLATTVKVDVPSAGYAAKKPRFTLAKMLGLNPERQAALRLQKIKREIDHQSAPKRKRRRSRLPLVIAFLAMLMAGGAYWLYQSITLPRLPVSQYLDYQKWLDTVSGKLKPGQARLGSTYQPEWHTERPVKTQSKSQLSSRSRSEPSKKNIASAKRGSVVKSESVAKRDGRSGKAQQFKTKPKSKAQNSGARTIQARSYRPLGQ